MVKTVATALSSHLSGSVLSLSWCWHIQRTDGEELGFTNFDADLTFGGLTYQAAAGFSPSAVDATNTTGVNNLELTSILKSDAITESDLVGGRYDGARIKVFLVNPHDLPSSLTDSPPKFILLLSGVLGPAINTGAAFKVEVRSLAQFLAQKRHWLTSKVCRYRFGDSRCGVNLASHTFTRTVVADSSTREIRLSSELSQAAGGTIEFTTGNNAGLSRPISKTAGELLTLFDPFPFPVEPGDEVTVVRGCLKDLASCKSYSNAANFGGEPHVPGADTYLSGEV